MVFVELGGERNLIEILLGFGLQICFSFVLHQIGSMTNPAVCYMEYCGYLAYVNHGDLISTQTIEAIRIMQNEGKT